MIPLIKYFKNKKLSKLDGCLVVASGLEQAGGVWMRLQQGSRRDPCDV